MNNLKKALGAAALVSVLAMTACGNDGSTSSSVSDTKTSATSENTTESQTTSSAASKSTTTSIVTTTAATTTTIAESTTVKTEAATNDAQGQDQDVDLSKRKDYIEQDERNIYSRCSIFGVLRNDNTTWGDLSLANADNSLQGIITKFGLKPIEGEGADYEGSMTAFGFNGKGYYTIADDKTSTKVYLMTDENGEVVGVVFTDFNKSSIPVAGNATDIGYGLNPEKHLALSSIRSDYEQFASEHTRYSYNFVTEDGYENGYSYERYNDEYYSMFFSMNVYYGESVDTYAVMDNRFIKENPDLKLKE